MTERTKTILSAVVFFGLAALCTYFGIVGGC
jgi:hypothetical protein